MNYQEQHILLIIYLEHHFQLDVLNVMDYVFLFVLSSKLRLPLYDLLVLKLKNLLMVLFLSQ